MDEGALGSMRIERTLKATAKTDIALLLCQPDMEEELPWIALLEEKNIPVVLILNKTDLPGRRAGCCQTDRRGVGQTSTSGQCTPPGGYRRDPPSDYRKTTVGFWRTNHTGRFG